MAFNNYLEDENDKPYFTTNSLAYYYDKMEGFAKAVEGSAKALNLTKEEVEKRLTLYIEQNKNELDQRLAQWDGKLETFDSSVEKLLTEWVDDGTLTHVIDSTLIDQRIAPVKAQLADKVGGTVKAELEDLSPTVLSAIEGGEGTGFNLLTIPQDESVSVEKFSPDVRSKLSDFGHKKPLHFKGKSSSGAYIYVAEYLFDLNELGLTHSTSLSVSFDYYTKDANITQIGVEVFLNNSNVPLTYTGGTNTKSALVVPEKNKIAKFNQNAGFYNNLYQFAHIFMAVHVTDLLADSEIYYGDLSMTVGSTNIPSTKLIGITKHRITPASILEEKFAPVLNVISSSEINGFEKSRFYGKKFNFIGDSITANTHVAATKKYWSHVQDKLGITVRDYGISASTIAPDSNGLCIRYADMDNDADVVVVFAGTNDYGLSQRYKGTMFNEDGTVNKDSAMTVWGSINTLFEGLASKYAERGTEIIVMTPIPRQAITAPNQWNGLLLKDVVAMLKESAAYYSFPVLNMFEVSRLQSRVPAIKTKYVPDGTHPNNAGHEIIANRLLGFLRTI